MARIDPAYPPLWRTSTALQFGADAVLVVDDPPAWQQRVVRELERGLPDVAAVPFAIASGASTREAERFLARLGPVLSRPVAQTSAVLHSAGDVPGDQLAVIADAMAAAGCLVEIAHPFDKPGATLARDATVVAVAHHLVPPAFGAALMADDLPHLPIVLSPRTAQVGPIVLPGRSACLSCLAAHRRDADPAWPAIAAQLIGRRASGVERALLLESGVVAARLLSSGESDRSTRLGRSLTLRAGSLRRDEEHHVPHAECRCRSLGGSERAVAPVRLAPTRPTAFAQPA